MSLFIPIFQLLNEAKVRYVVVGGIATILHGYVRLTADVDLVIDLHKRVRAPFGSLRYKQAAHSSIVGRTARSIATPLGKVPSVPCRATIPK